MPEPEDASAGPVERAEGGLERSRRDRDRRREAIEWKGEGERGGSRHHAERPPRDEERPPRDEKRRRDEPRDDGPHRNAVRTQTMITCFWRAERIEF